VLAPASDVIEVAILQPILAPYRSGFYTSLAALANGRVVLFHGDSSFAPGQAGSNACAVPTRRLRNRFVLKRSLLFQSGQLRELLRCRVLVAEFNYRTISTWMLLLLRRVLRRPSVLWGHARGRRSWVLPLRALMLRLADGFICYTAAQKDVLVAAGVRLPIAVASNACMHERDMSPSRGSTRTDFVFSGRLVPQKKPHLALTAFQRLIDRGVLSDDSRLIFVGDGPLRASLARAIGERGLGSRVLVAGQVDDSDRLRAMYASALASLSPGYVGLSVTQSFGFGVPAVIGRDEPHSPEIDLCSAGFNCVFFTSDDDEAMAQAMAEVVNHRSEWEARAEEIAALARREYSFETMASGFWGGLGHLLGDSQPGGRHSRGERA
jgi:glycosyltransferase involved in cell wall biosynthesis